MNDEDYLMDSLYSFNKDIPNWYGWKTHDDDGKKIPNSERMQYKYVKVIEKGATIPSEADVNAKIKELKDADTTKANNKKSAITKLKSLGLSDDEINALRL
tara:strand:+ start:625 stop:927 length:303 start_codon:yes stop_codon:yes gene_type:complete